MDDVRTSHAGCCECIEISEGRCGMTPPGMPRFILRGSRYQEQHGFAEPLCDYIVFWKDDEIGLSVAIIELKGGHVDRGVKDQLVNGGAIADSLTSISVGGFAALLACNKSPHPEDIKVLARTRVRFQNADYPIRTVRCGSKVEGVLPWRR
jgi:hypothetical protein